MISVIVPCYNCEKTLKESTLSILKQTNKNIEIILINDGSTDNTSKICEELAQKDNRIIVMKQRNQGLVKTWKNGIEISRGEYIAFVDSDDWIEEDLFERVQLIIDEKQADIISFGMTIDYPNDYSLFLDNYIENDYFDKKDIKEKILPKYFNSGKRESMSILPSRCNKIVKKTLFLKNFNLFNEQIDIGEDDLSSFIIVLDAQSIFNIKDYYPYHYCRRENSMLGNYNYKMIEKFILLREELIAVANKKEYIYIDQIEVNFLENILNVIKKIICNKKNSKKEICIQLKKIEKYYEVKEILKKKEIRYYFGIKEQIMIYLLCNRNYYILATLLRIRELICYKEIR